MPMGLRSAALCCQRIITNMIAHIHEKMAYFSKAYLDEFWIG